MFPGSLSALRLPIGLVLLAAVLQVPLRVHAQDAPPPTGMPTSSPVAPAADPPTGADLTGPTPEQLERARALFDEGLTLVERAEWEQAARRFEQVLKLKRSAVVAYNLASTLVQLGRRVDAVELLRGIVHDPEAAEDARAGAAQLLQDVEPTLGSLSVQLSGPTQDITVIIGTRELSAGRLDRPLEVDPGRHLIEAYRDGRVVASTTIRLGGEDPRSVVVPLLIPPRAPTPAQVAAASPATPAAAAPTTTTKRADDDAAFYQRWWFWAGAGAVVTTSVITALALSSAAATADPVMGDADPSLIMGRVVPR